MRHFWERLAQRFTVVRYDGRGIGLFGTPNHDAQAVADRLGPVPLAGFFCNGEVGPVGSRNFLHGHTASIPILVRRDPAPA